MRHQGGRRGSKRTGRGARRWSGKRGARWRPSWRRATSRCSACGATSLPCEWRLLDERARDQHCAPRMRRRPISVGRARCIRRRSGSSAPSTSLYGLEPPARSTRGRGSIIGFWDVQHPLGAEPTAPGEQRRYTFLPVEGESLHQIPVGPVHAGIIEPGHFRFTANGETVVRLEQRLGYVHKGIESLMRGASLEHGGAARRPHLRRQHGRLCARLRACRRGRACTSWFRRARSICGR